MQAAATYCLRGPAFFILLNLTKHFLHQTLQVKKWSNSNSFPPALRNSHDNYVVRTKELCMGFFLNENENENERNADGAVTSAYIVHEDTRMQEEQW